MQHTGTLTVIPSVEIIIASNKKNLRSKPHKNKDELVLLYNTKITLSIFKVLFTLNKLKPKLNV